MAWNYNIFEALADIFLGRWTWWNILILLVALALWLVWFDKRRKEDGQPGLLEGNWW